MNAYGVLVIYGLIALAIIKKNDFNDWQNNFGEARMRLKKAPSRMKIWSLVMVCGGAVAAVVDNLGTILPRFEHFMDSQIYFVKVLVAAGISIVGPVILIVLMYLPFESAFKKRR